jgi:hypothetical protein
MVDQKTLENVVPEKGLTLAQARSAIYLSMIQLTSEADISAFNKAEYLEVASNYFAAPNQLIEEIFSEGVERYGKHGRLESNEQLSNVFDYVGVAFMGKGFFKNKKP